MTSRRTGGRRPGGPRRLSRQAARAYQGVLEAVLSIPAGALLGYGLDAWLGTAPVGVLLGLGFGFAAFVLASVRLTRRMSPEPGESAEPAEEPGDASARGPHGNGTLPEEKPREES